MKDQIERLRRMARPLCDEATVVTTAGAKGYRVEVQLGTAPAVEATSKDLDEAFRNAGQELDKRLQARRAKLREELKTLETALGVS